MPIIKLDANQLVQHVSLESRIFTEVLAEEFGVNVGTIVNNFQKLNY